MAQSSQTAYDRIASSIQYNRNKYLDLTNQLNNYNEIYNMNQFVDNLNKKRYEHNENFDKTLKTQLYEQKQNYFITEYNIKHMQFWTNVMYFTIVMSCLGLLSVVVFKETIYFVIAIILLTIIYLIVMIIVTTKKVARRRYSWDQYYWQKVNI